MSNSTSRSDASEDLSVNPSCNPGFDDVLASVVARRRFLKGGAGAAALAFLGTAPLRPGAVHAAASGPTLGFAAVSRLGNDMVVVPPGYRVQVLYAWGDAIGKAGMLAGQPA